MRNAVFIAGLLFASIATAARAQSAPVRLRAGVYSVCGQRVPQLRVAQADGTWWFSSRLGTNLPWVGPFRSEPVKAAEIKKLNDLVWAQGKIQWGLRWGPNVVLGMIPGWKTHLRRPGAAPVAPDLLLGVDGGILYFCKQAPVPAPAQP